MRVLVPVANGVEDIETVTIIDVLRRAQAEVTVASIERDTLVTCARGVKITADTTLNEVKKDTFELIAVPGGSAGAAALAKNKALIEMLKHNRANRKWYAAICAAPASVPQTAAFTVSERGSGGASIAVSSSPSRRTRRSPSRTSRRGGRPGTCARRHGPPGRGPRRC